MKRLAGAGDAACVDRRTLLGGVGLLGGLGLVAGCSSSGGHAAAATSGSAEPTSTPGTAEAMSTAAVSGDVIMIIRHAEKPVAGGPVGVTPAGTSDSGSLTVAGWIRAGALTELFAPTGTPVRAGLVRPAAVFAARPGAAGGGQRPSQTVTPLAARLGVELDTTYRKGDEAALAAHLLDATGPVLVAWEHENIPAIVAHLGTITPTPPATWPGSRFDLVWVFPRSGSGRTFVQVPQLLLEGDRSA